MQNYFYDLHDQLVKAEIFKKDGEKETWVYRYDALGRRIAKAQTEVSDRHTEDNACLKDNRTEFLWDGSHLLQEQRSDGLYTYIYIDLDSYEPLAQVYNWTNVEGESQQQTNYFHCDQIGIPREMTDSDGKLLWFGDYHGWGKLKTETNITNAHQPFRLQNQYCDAETGLHYNFFRYYEPEAGRFVNQDPIGLWGGDNLYIFAPSSTTWVDVLGWHGQGTWAYMKCKMGGKNSKYTTIATGRSTNAGGKGAFNKLIDKLYKKYGTPSDGRNGKCAEAEMLSKIAKDNNLKTEAQLKKFLQDHKCISRAFRVENGVNLPPCKPNCEPVLKILGVK